MASNETVALTTPYTAFKQATHSLEILLIVGGNALTLIAVNRTKKLRIIPTNTFIVSLAVSDGLIGVLLPFIIWLNFTRDERLWDVSTCVLRGPYYAMFDISLSTLLVIAVDRYVAVVHPLYYRRHMTLRIARVTAVAIWIAEFLVLTSLTCYYGTRIETVVLIPIVGNIVLYSLIYIRLSRRQRSVSTNPNGGQNAETAAFVQPSKKTKTFTKMMALVLGYLILAWLPYYILVPIHNVNDPATPRWYVYMYDVAVVLFYSNSFMNPVIYSWKSRDFKEAYIKILRCRRSLNSSTAGFRGGGGVGGAGSHSTAISHM
ncbi:hypothetical protein LSH36_897g01078 [Paralvinella palmiformis]|uniref:G-protein coupled receptors family 1 profile domain-containing protein n=1 Tax=Paralvinella palmiformis TaxID=53620 RepID=A0AAD9IYL3_9ANNE|nr:hypothetical protein LSH36_897g01078 [Paralvinella palmiformis]